MDGEVPAVRITQPLELRFRDGGDRIPSTASVAANSSSLDRWTLSLPSDAELIDGISGRRLALADLVSATAEEGSISDLPGWDQILGRVPTARDIRLEVSEGSDGDGEAIRQLTATGSQARAFMDGLWLLGSDELADSSLSLTHSPVLRASLVPLEDGDAIERRVLVPELRGELTYRLEVVTTLDTADTEESEETEEAISSTQVFEVTSSEEPSLEELLEAWTAHEDFAELPFTLTIDPDSPGELLLVWKEETPAEGLGYTTDVVLVAADETAVAWLSSAFRVSRRRCSWMTTSSAMAAPCWSSMLISMTSITLQSLRCSCAPIVTF